MAFDMKRSNEPNILLSIISMLGLTWGGVLMLFCVIAVVFTLTPYGALPSRSSLTGNPGEITTLSTSSYSFSVQEIVTFAIAVGLSLPGDLLVFFIAMASTSRPKGITSLTVIPFAVAHFFLFTILGFFMPILSSAGFVWTLVRSPLTHLMPGILTAERAIMQGSSEVKGGRGDQVS